jgi:Glucose / Sorbosone dehydrogenase
MRRTVQIAVLLACLASLGWGTVARAATLAPVGTFDEPVFVTSDPKDADRLLVAEREGSVILLKGSERRVYADLQPLVQCCEGERGLLSILPASDFASSGRFFAAYTGEASAGGAVGDIHLDSFRPNPVGGPPLRQPILTIPHSSESNHNGGQLQSRDGYVYLSTGDGGGTGDPEGNAQDPTSLLGKIVRIDPAVGASSAFVWASGLRNPWRFSFDRLTGAMPIADVGQGRREEVNLGIASTNYGWNCREGFEPYVGAPPECTGRTGFTDPVFAYPHEDPGGDTAFGCSITGGYVVRDQNLSDLYGRYVYADFCIGEVRSLVLPSAPGGRASGDRSEGLSVPKPVSFGEDSCGRVYVVSQAGTIFRLQGTGGGGCFVGPPAPPPPAVATPARPRVLVILQARRRGRHAVKLFVHVLPCGENAGELVYLNRNGRPFLKRRLDGRCIARFRVRVSGRTRFRAFFEDQRSQVRKIALAKPRP